MLWRTSLRLPLILCFLALLPKKISKTFSRTDSSLPETQKEQLQEPFQGTSSNLQSSLWSHVANSKVSKTTQRVKLASDQPSSFDPFSSDPISAKNFQSSAPASNTDPSRKRPQDTQQKSNLQSTKYIRLSTSSNTPSPQYKSASDAIIASRDILVQAYVLTQDREEQSQLLNLLQVLECILRQVRSKSDKLIHQHQRQIKPLHKKSSKRPPLLRM